MRRPCADRAAAKRRAAKPLSHSVNFGCAKLFISVDRPQRFFQAGLQLERGYTAGLPEHPGNLLQEDWDWHRLTKGCRKGSTLDDELRRLILDEGFAVEIGDWDHNRVLDRESFVSAAQLRSASRKIPGNRWGGFQLYYPMPATEVNSCSGYELVKAVQAVFGQVIPAMNQCMQGPLKQVELPRPGAGASG